MVQKNVVFKFYLKCLLLLFLSVSASQYISNAAQVVITTNTNWNAAGINADDTVYVENGATLTLNVPAQCAALTLGSNESLPGDGTLSFNNGFNLRISNNLTVGLGANTGTINLSQDTIFIEGTIVNNNAFINLGFGTVDFSGGNQQIPVSASGWRYFNLTCSGTGTKTIENNGQLDVFGSLEIAGGVDLNTAGEDIVVKGSWTNNGTFNNGAATVTFNGVGASGTISGNLIGQNRFHKLNFDSTGNWSFFSDAEVNNKLSISNGAEVVVNPSKLLTINGNFLNVGSIFTSIDAYVSFKGDMTNDQGATFNSGIADTIYGNWLNKGGSDFFPDSGVVVFKGSGSQTVSNGVTSYFYNLINSCEDTLNLIINPLKILNDLVISSGSVLKTNAERIAISGNWTNNGVFIADNDTVFFFGSIPNRTISGFLSGTSSFASVLFSGIGTGGTWTILNPINLTGNFGVQGGYKVTANAFFDRVSGKALISGDSTEFKCGPYFVVDGNLEIDNKAKLEGDSIIVLKGNWINNGGDFIHNNSTVRFNGTSPATILSDGKPFFKIAHNTSSIVTLLDPLFADGDIIFPNTAGDLEANGENISLRGNWSVESNFIPGSASQTVTFNGANYQSLRTNSDFQNLSHTGISKLTVFPLNGTIGVLQDLKNNSGGIFDLDSNQVTITIGNNLENADVGTIFNAGPNLTVSGNFNNNTSATFNAGPTINAEGDWTNGTSSVFNHNSGTVIFSSSANQDVDNGADPFFNLTNLNNSGTVKLLSNTDIFGNFLNSNGATFNAFGKNIQIQKDWSNSGIFNPNGINQTVTFNGTGTQLVNNGNSDFQNLTHNASGTLQLVSNDIVVDGDLNNLSGTFDADINNINVTINGNFNNDNATYNSGASMILAGNWINNGTFDPGNGTSKVTFSGSSQQNISGSSLTTFKRVEISNDVNLAGVDIRISNDLQFLGSNNLITTNTNTVILDSTTSTSANQANGYINGNQSVTIKTNTGVVTTFIIGDSLIYAPVTIKFNGATSGAGSLTAFTQPGNAPNENNPVTNASGINQLKKVNRYWNVSNQNVIFSDFNATFNFNASDLTTTLDTSKVVVRKYDSGPGDWQTTTIGAKTLISTQCKNNTSFGEFTTGEAGIISVSTSPNDITICESVDTSLVAASLATPVAKIQWERNDNTGGGFQEIIAGMDGGVYGNSYNTGVLTFSNPTFALNGFLYRAVFTNINGSTVTTPAQLSIDKAVLISGQPVGLELCADSIAVFTVSASGQALTYQWYKDGVILSGATQNSLTISSVALGDSGNYYCIVSGQGICPPQQSDIAILSIKPQPPKPNISSALLDSISPFCSGTSNISFLLDDVDPSFSFLWSSTSVPPLIIQDSLHNAVISAPNSGGAYQGNIHVVYTNSINCTSKSTFIIDVKQDVAPETAPVILKQPGNLLIYLDNTADQYIWGFDRPSDLMPDTIAGQVYQAFVPDSAFLIDDPNTAELNDMILNTNDFYFWVGVKDGECATKVYYNGPYAKKSPGEITPVLPEEINMNAFPNPSQGQFDLTVSGNIYGAIELMVLNSLGQAMDIHKVNKTEGVQKFNFNLKELPSGLYFIKLKGGQNQHLAIKLFIK